MSAYNNVSSNNQGRSYASQTPTPVQAEPLPAEYVDAAEQVILGLDSRFAITNTKLRNLFSMIAEIANEENLRTEDQMLPQSLTQLMQARIRMVYEAGRERSVKTFLQEAKLLEYLKDIGTDRQKLLRYSHYMEALVAYHRYYIGGKEK